MTTISLPQAAPAPPDLPMPRPRWRAEVLLPSAALVAVMAVPVLVLLSMAFNAGDPQAIPAKEYGAGSFREILDHLDWIKNTLIIAGGGTVLAVLMAICISWALFRTDVPGRRWFDLLIAIPYPLGPLVGALAWHQLGSSHHGLINEAFRWATTSDLTLINTSSLSGIVIISALFEAPVAVMIIGAAMQRMDSSLEECSAMLGGSTARTAFTITLPLMLPAILSASLFLFVSMTGAFAIPAILGAEERIFVVTTAIYQLFQSYPPRYPLAAALGVFLIGLASVALWLHSWLLRGRMHAVISGKSYRSTPIRLRRGARYAVLAGLSIYAFLTVVLPLGTLMLAALQKTSDVSFNPSQWTFANFRYVVMEFPNTRQAIVNSVALAFGTGTLGAGIAAVLAWVVYRSRSAGRGLLEQLTMVPQAFPHVIFAVGFLWTVLILPIRIYNTLWAIQIAFVILFLPLAFRSMSGVIVQLSPSLEEAGRVLGASWLRMFMTITVPILAAGVASTWALLFMISVREVSASIFLAGPESPVLGPAIYSFWDSGGMPKVSALAMVQALIVLAALFGVRAIVSRSNRTLA